VKDIPRIPDLLPKQSAARPGADKYFARDDASRVSTASAIREIANDYQLWKTRNQLLQFFCLP
jgi:hypothetical protein